MKITNIEDTYKIEQELLRILDNLYDLDEAYNIRGESVIDNRWLAIARTDLEKGFMALRRAMRSLEIAE